MESKILKIPVCDLYKSEGDAPMLETIREVEWKNGFSTNQLHSAKSAIDFSSNVFFSKNRTVEYLFLVAMGNDLVPLMVSKINGTLAGMNKDSLHEICLKCMLAGASGFILVTNHVSDKSAATEAEKSAMYRVRHIAKSVGLDSWDSVIQGEDGWYSFYEEELGGSSTLGLKHTDVKRYGPH